MTIHPPNPLESVPDLVRPGTVFLSYRGSESHGTTLPPGDEFGTDDVDLMGASVHPLEHYFGSGRRQTLERWVGEYDIVEHGLGKLVSLLLKSNPNVISLLWLPPRSVLVSSPAHERLIENRSLFASGAVYDSFCAYASGQLRRMTRLVDNNPGRDREMEALNAEIQHRRDMERVHGPGDYARQQVLQDVLVADARGPAVGRENRSVELLVGSRKCCW